MMRPVENEACHSICVTMVNGGQYAESRVRAFYQPVLTRWPPGADGGRTLTAPLSLTSPALLLTPP